METSFPDLPFLGYGNAALAHTHTTSKMTPRAYPRTDLQTLQPWTTFANDIDQAIQSAFTNSNLSPAPFTIGASRTDRMVANEEYLRVHATVELHEPVAAILAKLGVEGSFAFSGTGNINIIGNPDFSWVMRRDQLHPKLIVEYKTWWAADLLDILGAFTGTRRGTLGRQSLEALLQIYGYLTFNNNKFGILSNWQRALFLRRAETSDRKTLEYYLVELDGPGQPISMLKAWVGMVLLAENDWFYASSTTSASPGRNLGITDAQGYLSMLPVNGEYECTTLDFRLCRFDLSSTRRGENSCVVDARFPSPAPGKPDLQVVCKVFDVLRWPDAGTLLDDEACAYVALEDLQGQVIPTLYGYYEVWGILKLLALEPVGHAIPEDDEISEALRLKMKATLQRIHDAGFLHGDVARRNFCRTGGGDVFLVDLERCRAGDPSELVNEMSEVDRL